MTLDERTQELLAVRIGMAIIANARLQAEHEALRAEIAAAAAEAERSNGAQGAIVSGTERHDG